MKLAACITIRPASIQGSMSGNGSHVVASDSVHLQSCKTLHTRPSLSSCSVLEVLQLQTTQAAKGKKANGGKPGSTTPPGDPKPTLRRGKKSFRKPEELIARRMIYTIHIYSIIIHKYNRTTEMIDKRERERHTHTHAYIYMAPPPPCTHACLLNLGFGKAWVLGMPLFQCLSPKSQLQDGVH